MIIDPKLERMFRRCQIHKKRIDRQQKLIRAAMFSLPAILAILCLIHMFLTAFSAFAILAVDGPQASYPDAACFLVSVAIAVFAAGETMLENRTLMTISDLFYPAALVACLILNLYATGKYVASLLDILGHLIMIGQYLLTVSCGLSVWLNLRFKRLYAENETLRTLKGYPHFDPMFLTEADLREEETPDEKPLEELTPDERLMRERDMRL